MTKDHSAACETRRPNQVIEREQEEARSSDVGMHRFLTEADTTAATASKETTHGTDATMELLNETPWNENSRNDMDERVERAFKVGDLQATGVGHDFAPQRFPPYDAL